MLLLIADAATSTGFSLTDMLPAVSSLTSIGFTVWLSYYTTTVTIPNMQKEHRDERKATQDSFTQNLKDLLSELKEARLDFERWKSKS